MFSGWGMSETAPAALQTHESVERPGNIGVPLPEVTVKLLIPTRTDAVSSASPVPNVLKGYFHDPEKSKEAFDDEGFLITNDAVKFVDSVECNCWPDLRRPHLRRL